MSAILLFYRQREDGAQKMGYELDAVLASFRPAAADLKK